MISNGYISYLFNLAEDITIIYVDDFYCVDTGQNPKHVFVNKTTSNQRLLRAINTLHGFFFVFGVFFVIEIEVTH